MSQHCVEPSVFDFCHIFQGLCSFQHHILQTNILTCGILLFWFLFPCSKCYLRPVPENRESTQCTGRILQREGDCQTIQGSLIILELTTFTDL